jgi:Tfp pilus assembly protein PilO
MKPKQFFFIVLAVIVGAIAAGGYGYVYALGRLTAAKTAYATALGQQTSEDAMIKSLSHMRLVYAKDVVPALPLMDAALPHTKNQTEFLAQLKVIASNRGLNLGSVAFSNSVGLPSNVSQTTASGTALALPVTFGVEGSFIQLQNFLSDLEHLNRFTNVTSLTVSRADKLKPIDYSITLNAYVKP